MATAVGTATLPYVVLLPTPSGMPATGGDSLTENLNVYYEVNSTVPEQTT